MLTNDTWLPIRYNEWATSKKIVRENGYKHSIGYNVFFNTEIKRLNISDF